MTEQRRRADERHAQDAHDGRHETELERRDRQLSELLQELRVVQTGVQVMFAFLLGVPFATGFDALGGTQRLLYFAALLLAALSIMLLLAPTAWHRLLFTRGDKPHLMTVAQRFAVAGLATVGVTVVAVIALVASVLYPGVVTALVTGAMTAIGILLWVVLPLRRRSAVAARRPVGQNGGQMSQARPDLDAPRPSCQA